MCSRDATSPGWRCRLCTPFGCRTSILENTSCGCRRRDHSGHRRLGLELSLCFRPAIADFRHELDLLLHQLSRVAHLGFQQLCPNEVVELLELLGDLPALLKVERPLQLLQDEHCVTDSLGAFLKIACLNRGVGPPHVVE